MTGDKHHVLLKDGRGAKLLFARADEEDEGRVAGSVGTVSGRRWGERLSCGWVSGMLSIHAAGSPWVRRGHVVLED